MDQVDVGVCHGISISIASRHSRQELRRRDKTHPLWCFTDSNFTLKPQPSGSGIHVRFPLAAHTAHSNHWTGPSSLPRSPVKHGKPLFVSLTLTIYVLFCIFVVVGVLYNITDIRYVQVGKFTRQWFGEVNHFISEDVEWARAAEWPDYQHINSKHFGPARYFLSVASGQL